MYFALNCKQIIVICILLLCSKPAIAETPALITHLKTHTLTHKSELEPIPSSSYKLAKVTFLPELQDSEIPLANIAHRNDSCPAYPLTSCPRHGICSPCPFNRQKLKLNACQETYTKNGDTCVDNEFCRENETTFKSIPKDYKCTMADSKRDNMFVTTFCYYGCKAINCNGYTLDCASIDKTALHIAGMTTCPDCSSQTLTNCSKTYCKISSCISGYKIANNGSSCIALDDNCPTSYFKTCETGTTGDPEYTEAGTACYQCKAKTSTTVVNIDAYISKKQVTTPGKYSFTISYTADGIISDDMILMPVHETYNSGYKANLLEDEYMVITDRRTTGTSSGSWTTTPRNYTAGEISELLPMTLALCDIDDTSICSLTRMPIANSPLSYKNTYNLTTHICSVENCSECIEKSSTQCKTCKTGYTLSNGQCNATVSGLPILYSDLTTSTEVVANKTPIGVVFDESRKLAVALTESSSGGVSFWSSTNFDIPGLNNYDSAAEAKKDLNGRENTKTIINYCKANSKSCPAAEYANDYTTPGTVAGDWHLPSLGELSALFAKQTAVEETLTKVEGTTILNNNYSYTSSTEHSSANTWTHNSQDIGYTIKNDHYNHTRPVIDYTCRPLSDDNECADWRQYPCSDGCGGQRKCCGPYGYKFASCSRWIAMCKESEVYEAQYVCEVNWLEPCDILGPSAAECSETEYDKCMDDVEFNQCSEILPDDAQDFIYTSPDGCLN